MNLRAQTVTLAVALAALLTAAPVKAETKTWIGGDSGQWEEGANWSPVGEPTDTSEVTINAGAGEVCVGLLRPYSPGSYHEANTLYTVSTPEGEVCLERWTGDWFYMHVHDGVLNQGRLCLEGFELETTTITNQGYLDLDTMEVIADIENYGAMVTWGADIEGDVTCHADSVYQVEGYAEIASQDDDTGGNFDNHGEVWLGGHASMEVDGTLHNHAAGHITGGSGAIRAWGGLVNDGLLNSWGMDLGIHCPESTFTNTGHVYNTSGSTVSVIADSVTQQGVVTVFPDGAVNFACDLLNEAGATIHLLGGTLSAHDIVHEAGATLDGFGHVACHDQAGEFRTLTNLGDMEFVADTRVVGHLDNQAGAVITGRNGDFTVLGDLTNDGTITWENGGIYCEGTWSGAGVLTLAGEEVKAVNGALAIDPGGALNVTGTGPTHLYADINCRGIMTVGEDATAVCLGGLSGGVESLTVAGGSTPTGTLDLTVNNFVQDYDPSPNQYEEIVDAVKSGWNSGAWDGTGIICDGDTGTWALGVADNADPDFPTRADLEGVPVDVTSVLVRYTFYGNANLDDRVDAADLSKLLGNFGNIEANPADVMAWFLGNFNYDDRVDAADLSKLLGNFGNIETGGTGEPPAGLGGMALAPEPATLALVALGVGAVLVRRRRTER